MSVDPIIPSIEKDKSEAERQAETDRKLKEAEEDLIQRPSTGNDTPTTEDDGGYTLSNGVYIKSSEVELFESFGTFEDAKLNIAQPREMPPPIVEGLINRREFTLVSSDSKGMKTWFLMQMVLSAVLGKDFLGFKTRPSRVLYLNFELLPEAWDKRIGILARGLGGRLEGTEGWLKVWQLRGKEMRVEHVSWAIRYGMEKGGIDEVDLVVVDPLYTLMRGKSEIDAGEVSEGAYEFIRVATELNAAVVGCGHYAKGDAQSKKHLDRMSGSGVFARITDNFATLTTKGKEGQQYVELEVTRRHFKSPEPTIVKWNPETFLWERGEKPLVPSPAAAALDGKGKGALAVDWLGFFPAVDQGYRACELKERFRRNTGLGETSAENALKEAVGRLGILQKKGRGQATRYYLSLRSRQEWCGRKDTPKGGLVQTTLFPERGCG